jgi:hypothetical protein
MKIISGFTMTGHLSIFDQASGYKIHNTVFTDIPLLFIFLFHAAYGILKIYMPKRNEKKIRAFIITNILALLIFLAAMAAIYI